jgi:hypothetical protein
MTNPEPEPVPADVGEPDHSMVMYYGIVEVAAPVVPEAPATT